MATFPNLVEAIANRGYNAGEITKLRRANWMRLFQRAWSP